VLSPAAGGCRCSLPLLSTSHAHRFGGVNRLTGHDVRVTGVVTGEGEDEPAIYADLVVDGSGCGSRDGAWLEALGGAAPPVDQVRIDMGYASRLLHRTPGQLPDRTWIAILGHAPQSKRLAIAVPVEGERWLLTLAGFFGDHAPPAMPTSWRSPIPCRPAASPTCCGRPSR
jgi:hypothetical protein